MIDYVATVSIHLQKLKAFVHTCLLGLFSFFLSFFLMATVGIFFQKFKVFVLVCKDYLLTFFLSFLLACCQIVKFCPKKTTDRVARN
jgi:hypothetical protein